MKDELKLAVSRQIDGIEFDCYVKQGQVDPQDFWATREQIGRLLGYTEPSDAIAKIHRRNKERLDKFSGMDKLSTPSGVQVQEQRRRTVGNSTRQSVSG